MATSQEILEALADYQVQCNENKRLRKMQRDWSKLIHFVAEDTGDTFTMNVVKGEIVSFEAGHQGDARYHRDDDERESLRHVLGRPESLAEIPAGRNPRQGEPGGHRAD